MCASNLLSALSVVAPLQSLELVDAAVGVDSQGDPSRKMTSLTHSSAR